MKRTIIVFVVFLLPMTMFGQKLDVYGRKMVKSVTMRGNYTNNDIVYEYDGKGLVTKITSDCKVPPCGMGSRIKATLTMANGELRYVDEISGDKMNATYVVKDRRITLKSLTVGEATRYVHEYTYTNDGHIESMWENDRCLVTGRFCYDPGVWMYKFDFGGGVFNNYLAQYYEYSDRRLSETKVHGIRDFDLGAVGKEQHHHSSVVFSDKKNDTNLCIESFMEVYPCSYNGFNGVEWTCDWMGMYSTNLPEYIKTPTKLVSGKNIVNINKVIMYDYDGRGNLTGFSVSYDHDHSGYKAYETTCRVEFKYVE